MNYDVIFLSDAKKALVAASWISDATKAAVWSIRDNVPIVDAETAFPQLRLVKEAFDMAKTDLVPVVRCENCTHQQKVWHDDKRMKEGGFFIYSCKLNEDPFVTHVVDGNPGEFCYAGERRTAP